MRLGWGQGQWSRSVLVLGSFTHISLGQVSTMHCAMDQIRDNRESDIYTLILYSVQRQSEVYECIINSAGINSHNLSFGFSRAGLIIRVGIRVTAGVLMLGEAEGRSYGQGEHHG